MWWMLLITSKSTHDRPVGMNLNLRVLAQHLNGGIEENYEKIE
jgi:hypothetical protein